MISRRSLFFATGAIAATHGALAETPSTWKAGTHYTEIKQARPSQTQQKVREVIEFFWYGCPQCYIFEPHFVLWEHQKPADLVLRRQPVAWRPERVPHSRLFYALQSLNRGDLHGIVFDEIHRIGNPLSSFDEQVAFARKYRLDEEQFRAAYFAENVDTALQSAQELSRSYKISGVPSLTINGKYTSDAGKTRGERELLALAEYLIDRS